MTKQSSRMIAVKDLLEAHINRMYNLMTRYYDNLSMSKFQQDLKRKNHAILLEDQEGIYGFSTIEYHPMTIDGVQVLGIFSGDTIVDQDRPMGFLLQQGFCRHIHGLIQSESRPVYWFLICKGYRTYKYLPMYFNEYFPRGEHPIPAFEKKIMDSYASSKYGDSYDPTMGIIRNTGFNDWLKEGVAPIDDSLRTNPVVATFERLNPGHGQGDELVCLARFSEGNLKKAFHRMVNR